MSKVCSSQLHYWECVAKGVVHATNEVIISAGAIDTPKLLMLSGIGPSQVLKAAHVDVKLDIPGVGQNLGDHMLLVSAISFSSNFENRGTFDFEPTCLF